MEKKNPEDHYFPPVTWEMQEFEHQGYILDVGGGGEGVIGQLKGKDVVAIDFRIEELIEAEDGPLKIVMDARELKFLDETFLTATAFFSLMYIRKPDDQLKVFKEVWRVLKPGGVFHIWDVDLSQKPVPGTKYYIVHLFYQIRDQVTETGYGMVWPEKPRGIQHYRDLARQAGFITGTSKLVGNTFYMRLKKK
jgi:ubiquinone/menaquinone biosynthesis C-methylase UbiE